MKWPLRNLDLIREYMREFLKKLKQFTKNCVRIAKNKGLKTTAGRRIQVGPPVTLLELIQDLSRLSINRGDVVFVHSSLRSIGNVTGGAVTVLQALKEAVGEEGTIIMPAYWMPGGSMQSACSTPGYVFDVKKCGTSMGAIPAALLKITGVKRSVHPTHSCAAWGPGAEYLTSGHHQAPSVFGEGSPWERLAKMQNAKVMGLGVSMGPVTFYHRLEDEMGEKFPVPVWGDKTYEIPSVDQHGQTWNVKVRPYDPKVTRHRIDHRHREDLATWFAAEFDRCGLRTTGKFGHAETWTISAPLFINHLRWLASSGVTIYSKQTELQKVTINLVK
jgi:aminoglycoside 3-N-acetyltransferase